MYTETRGKTQLNTSVNETVHTENTGLNRQVYQRLKLALSLGLRRQILFAICDDLHLRNRIAARLHSTLAYPVGKVLYQRDNVGDFSTPAYPRLVTIRLNLSDPNPIAQINQWLANYPPPLVGGSTENPGRPLPIPGFQIVGVEMLTKEPVAVQRLFLNYLHLSEQHLSGYESSRFLESSLLFWVSRPWLSAIQQSAPKFWHCRTGVFVFEGEPTPTIDNRGYSEVVADSRSLERENLDNLIVNEEKISPDIKATNKPDLPLTTTTDLSTEIPEKSPVPSPQTTNNQRELALSHINQELQGLIKETITADNSDQIQQILGEIEQLHIQKAKEEELGIAYQNLGNFYRLQIEEGKATAENLMIAILAYQEAVSYDESSPQLPDVLNDLGTLYWMLHRIPDNSEEAKIYIQQGIDFYKLALKLITGDTQPETYTRIQNNLGTAYGDLARFADAVENWNLAIVAYDEALRYRQEDIEPLKYAACQNNLGTAYWHLGQYNQPVEHLTRAIAAYKLAVIHYQPTDEPLKYGMIQNNIGTAYWNLSQYEQPVENLQLAIQVYNEALKYRTSADVPQAYAATQNNLGIAYWHLANQPQTTKEDQQKLIKLCINAYEETVNIAHSFTNLPLNFDLYVTHNNLALAHHDLVTNLSFNGDKKTLSQHLEAALENHLHALSGFDRKTENYQTTIGYIVNIIRTFHNELGIQGQNLALSKLPGQLLPDILRKL
ncbi:tetratricopeptide repeat protein [Aphanizomenon sp. PH219]|uniref:Tetratricopeptide repeat protein n=1 Tax=Dolichospermum heterosporum TAC447 TaxID=747523 RepID=A0ABY5LQF2_9CYAN|nr:MULTISPECIES: tetratricopeptide repeat protein [Aphanizomenonaceae]MDK2409237.1 tetratricopeptide repeat protein [Aphanizomenon sp. 202]MDK2458952.1 tetratricopeptide repeat protein [Aphanizomenon sp. PH219]UUO13249.1 tetratricopeptide repeat protein [Dolichospermum heterosporum TAC447]